MSNRVLVLQDIVKALSHETDTSEALCQSFVKELFAIVAERLMDGESVTLKGVGRGALCCRPGYGRCNQQCV